MLENNIMKLQMNRLNRILSYLLEEMKNLNDVDRDLPIRWSIMHLYTSSQLAKVVAIKRNLDPEIAGIIAALHDIGSIKTKIRENHARNAEEYVIEVIDIYNTQLRNKLPIITKDETKIIVDAVISHSDKDKSDGSEYTELMKDVDSLDRYLHGIKTIGDHCKRCSETLKELELPYAKYNSRVDDST